MSRVCSGLALVLALGLFAASASAQESTMVQAGSVPEFGTMWTFDAPPLEYWATRYDFQPDQRWLDHLRLAAVRIPGCSSSFVSEDGLIMTNHHCARGCVAQVSPPETNYLRTGFVAESRADELQCPNMYADQLIAIEDVTDELNGRITAMSVAEQAEQRQAAVGEIQEACEDGPMFRCQVVPFYNGGMYSLYKYRRYGDLRLVMVPELEAAHFGGDPDNFTYPRYALDMSFLRVYEDGAPVHPEHFLAWSEAGAGDGEPVFVVGNPGSTGRLLTLAQMEYLRDFGYPGQLEGYERQMADLRALSAESAENARRYETPILGLENSFKAVNGYLTGLLDPDIMRRKAEFEKDFRARIEADPELNDAYGSAWDEISGAQRELASLAIPNRYYGLRATALLGRAISLVRMVRQEQLPDAERFANYRSDQIDRVRQGILTNQAVNADAEERMLASWLAAAKDELGDDDPLVRALIGIRTPEAAAAYLVRESKLIEMADREALVSGGMAALEDCTDPLVHAIMQIEPLASDYARRTIMLNEVVAANSEKLGKAIFAAYGTALPPDATFTLRISDGVVKGFPMNGTIAPYKTSLYGLFARSAEFDHVPPFELTEKWQRAEGSLDMSTPLNFVSTTDIIGGNSGSPVVNRAGEVVGLVFDGNIQMLPNRFIFTDAISRTVSVHSMAITEALRKVYGAGHLADELQGGGM